jgi:hypothetical protein
MTIWSISKARFYLVCGVIIVLSATRCTAVRSKKRLFARAHPDHLRLHDG